MPSVVLSHPTEDSATLLSQASSVQELSEVWGAVQAEDKEGETPLSVAATKGLRQLLVDVATGKTSADELMEDL